MQRHSCGDIQCLISPCFPCRGRETGIPAEAAPKQAACNEEGGSNFAGVMSTCLTGSKAALPVACVRFTLASSVSAPGSPSSQRCCRTVCAAGLCRGCDAAATLAGGCQAVFPSSSARCHPVLFAISPLPGPLSLQKPLKADSCLRALCTRPAEGQMSFSGWQCN